MYCSVQNFFFKIVTNFSAPLPIFNPFLKCISEFGGQNASKHLVTGQEVVFICKKHQVFQLFFQFWKQQKITSDKI